MDNLTRPITLPITYPLTNPVTGAWRRSSAPAFSLTAPVLAFASATNPSNDNTQDVTATFGDDIEGLVVRIVGMRNAAIPSSGPYDIDETNTIDSGEASAFEAAFPGLVLSPDGLWRLTGWIQDGSAVQLSARATEFSKTIATGAAFFAPRFFANRYFGERYFG